MLILVKTCLLASVAGYNAFSFDSSKSSYKQVPNGYELVAVAVFHRHGDRSQVSRSPGPAFLHSVERDAEWKSRMPSAESRKLMSRAAADETEFDDPAAKEVLERGIDIDFDEINALEKDLYSGWERANFPYGMLTEVGFQEMKAVGEELRRRYRGSLLPQEEQEPLNHEWIYARSTNFCRTKQSLRGLLVGLQGTSLDSDSNSKRIQIQTRPRHTETMYPQAGGPCAAIGLRRAELYADNYIEETFENYTTTQAAVSAAYGYDRAELPVNWMTVREVMVCEHVHALASPEGVTAALVSTVNSLAGLLWHRLFSDFQMNRLAVGRFMGDVATRIVEAVQNPRSETRMLIWSGHDSTLVPVLCALGLCVEGEGGAEWPPYASHLELEVARDADGQLYVRAIYNNSERVMLGCTGVWCPFFRFQRALKQVSLSDEAYAAECGMDEDVDNAAAAAMEAEIRATTGGN